MFKKILIANRGEIACRVIGTAKALGIHCVAVYSEIDKHSLHVKLADSAFCIGPAASKDSYLNVNAILAVAKQENVEAIHPGYGFLSENANFAQQCQQNNIVFIGPPVEAIKSMGSKSAAKIIMEKAKVPLLSGYHQQDQDVKTLQSAADKIGYPVMLKAVSGGGGKGMRVVKHAAEFEQALQSAKREAKASFADETMLIEKYLQSPRHVEIQVFADSQGNVVHLFERDCSIQRRHQKIVEESPAPGMTATLRQKMGAAAIAAAKAIGYVGAGTVEFLLDADNKFYFMEMNTRLQVEHPVTEMITKQDLVAWQLHVAAGEVLPCKQKDLSIQGHALEVRIYAENPYNDFLPSTGEIVHLSTPLQSSHVRIDSGIIQGDLISSYYDPMIAKLIVWDDNRELALRQLQKALSHYQIVGVHTNISFLQQILAQPDFINEKISTHFIESHQADLNLGEQSVSPTAFVLATLALFVKRQPVEKSQLSPWEIADGWQMNASHKQRFYFARADKTDYSIELLCEQLDLVVSVDEQQFICRINTVENQHFDVMINATDIKATVVENKNCLDIFYHDKHEVVEIHDPLSTVHHDEEAASHLASPMPGTIVDVMTKVGAKVKRGTSLLVIEAMKMEHTIHAPSDGLVKQLHFHIGDQVSEGEELLEFEVVEDEI